MSLPCNGLPGAVYYRWSARCLEEQLGSAGFNDIVMSCKCPVTAQQWGDLESEWRRGCEYVYENLKLRLAFYWKLPWAILGGCRPNLLKSKDLLRNALALWDDLPHDAQQLQHTLACQLFLPGPLRRELDSYLTDDDAFLEDVPLLAEFLAPLTFTQVAERIIEAAHKEMGTVSKAKSPAALSVALRSSELNRRLALQDSFFGDWWMLLTKRVT